MSDLEVCGACKITQSDTTQAIVSIPSSSYKYILRSFPQVFIASMLVWGISYTAIAGSPIPKNGFWNKDFLMLNNDQKKFWITGAIEALVHVAAAKKQQQGQCVYDWYYTDTPQKNGLILGSIEKYPNSTPSAVLLALTERECGSYRK